jgi:hypothetical protein
VNKKHTKIVLAVASSGLLTAVVATMVGQNAAGLGSAAAVGTYVLPEVSPENRTPVTSERIFNNEATVPPQCYTKTEGRHNPCYTCHQMYDRRGRPAQSAR